MHRNTFICESYGIINSSIYILSFSLWEVVKNHKTHGQKFRCQKKNIIFFICRAFLLDIPYVLFHSVIYCFSNECV